jgi:hypothetical protein
MVEFQRDPTGIAFPVGSHWDPGGIPVVNIWEFWWEPSGIVILLGSRFEVGSRFGWDPSQNLGIPIDQHTDNCTWLIIFMANHLWTNPIQHKIPKTKYVEINK